MEYIGFDWVLQVSVGFVVTGQKSRKKKINK